MKIKNIVVSFLVTALLILCAYYFLDARIARFVKKTLMHHHALSMNIPDGLFVIVCVVSGSAWAVYLHLSHKGVFNEHTRFSHLVALTMPLAFLLKSILKIAVGRIDTRFWVQHQRFKEFHWLHGGGNYSSFPSGHMAVFTVFFIAAAHFYPRYRWVCFGLLLLLAAALIATNYHFLSDIIAGAYLGFLVDYALRRRLGILPETAERTERRE